MKRETIDWEKTFANHLSKDSMFKAVMEREDRTKHDLFLQKAVAEWSRDQYEKKLHRKKD